MPRITNLQLKAKWPCAFDRPSDTLLKMIDPKIAEAWKTAFDKKAPFGDLRNSWRREHCRTLNPYGSDQCPYPLWRCEMAFDAVVHATTQRASSSPMGYFLKAARMSAAKRADLAQYNRLTKRSMSDRLTRTDVPIENETPQGSGDPGTAGTHTTEGQGLHSTQTGPISIGDVFRSLDTGPRPRPTDDGEEGAK